MVPYFIYHKLVDVRFNEASKEAEGRWRIRLAGSNPSGGPGLPDKLATWLGDRLTRPGRSYQSPASIHDEPACSCR